VLEPIFEADFVPVSYGFRPMRRAHDAIAEVHMFGTKGYRWVLDADIEACFDNIDHTALMGRVRDRVKDKRVMLLVKAFLKAGIMTELGESKETPTGTPQGGILSPLLANIALSVLDEHLTSRWRPDGDMATASRRTKRRRNGMANWRVVRYADLCRARHKSAWGYSVDRTFAGQTALQGRFARGRSKVGGWPGDEGGLGGTLLGCGSATRSR